jgi:hypothetical protein
VIHHVQSLQSMSSTSKVHACDKELLAADSRPEFHSFVLSRLQAAGSGSRRARISHRGLLGLLGAAIGLRMGLVGEGSVIRCHLFGRGACARTQASSRAIIRRLQVLWSPQSRR